MAFTKRWRVVCPKCDHDVRSERLSCGNCGRGEIKTEISRLFLLPFTISHGCDRCGQSVSTIPCPQCGCELRSTVERRFGFK